MSRETTPKNSERPEPGLYIVATPIGNLADMTNRARAVLGAADVIACEDTRVTGKLLSYYEISAPMIAYHDHNAKKMRPQILSRLEAGQVVALVSDAGTPLISDPGCKLVEQCTQQGIAVFPIPGASAVLSALVVSALPTDRFFFAGFLPPKTTARMKELRTLADIPATLVFFETAPRLAQSLSDMLGALGDRPAAVARELTKKFEEVRRDSLSNLCAHYQENGAPKGEIVIVVGAPPAGKNEISDDEIESLLRQALESKSLRDAATQVAAQTGRPRREVYEMALKLK